jgi:hypothetical protein
MLFFLVMSGDWSHKVNIIKRNSITPYILAIELIYVLGLFYSTSPWHMALVVLKKQSELLFSIVLLPLFYEQNALKSKCYVAFIIGAMVTVLLGGLNYFNIFDIASLFGRAPQSPASPILIHIYSSMFVSFAAFIAIHHTSREDKHYLWYRIAFFIMSTYLLILNNSRTGYITFGILCLAFILQRCQNKSRKIIGLLLLAIGFSTALVLSKNLEKGMTSIIDNVQQYQKNQDKTDTGIRLAYAKLSYELWRKKFILGYGTGGFVPAYNNIHGITAIGETSTASHPQASPENSFYFMAVEHGLIGLIVLFILLYKLWKSSLKIEDRKACYLAQGLIIILIVGSFSAPLLLDESPLLLFAFFIGMLFESCK